MKSEKQNVLKSIVDLVSSLQKSLHKVRQNTQENSQAIKSLVEQNEAIRSNERAISAQSFQRDEKLGAAVAANKKEADDREFRQALRDQNNVQSLVNLRESAQKGFNQVKADIQELTNRDSKINTRISSLENTYNDLLERAKCEETCTPAPAPQMPSDHVWVNKKLSGVYDVLTDFLKRLEKLERKAMPLMVNYLGNEVRFLGDELYVGGAAFALPQDIAAVSVQSFGLLITVKNGDQYILCGGPAPVTMYLNFFKALTQPVLGSWSTRS